MSSTDTGTATPRHHAYVRTAALLLAVVLPFALNSLALFIALLSLAVVYSRLRERSAPWHRLRWTSALPWMALFYLLHVLAMAWSTNTAHGTFDLEVKASLLLFPVLLWLLPMGTPLPARPVLRGFAWICALTVLLCLGAALYHFGHEWWLRGQGLLPEDPAWTNHFFESRFSLFLHPSYMALYLCFALAAWYHEGLWREAGRWLGALVPALLVLGVILCNSKMGWLTLGLLMIHVIVGLRHEVHARRMLWGLAAAGLLLFAGLFAAFPTVSGKVTQAISASGAIDPASDQSSALRRMAWDAATDLFVAQPWTGTGTGDIKDDLMEVYTAKGYVHAAAKRMNPHSQFLQAAATLGLPGLLVLLAMLLLPLWTAWRKGQRLATVFWVLIILNWTVESMAETQAGVVFFAFFVWLLEGGTDGVGELEAR